MAPPHCQHDGVFGYEGTQDTRESTTGTRTTEMMWVRGKAAGQQFLSEHRSEVIMQLLHYRWCYGAKDATRVRMGAGRERGETVEYSGER